MKDKKKKDLNKKKFIKKQAFLNKNEKKVLLPAAAPLDITLKTNLSELDNLIEELTQEFIKKTNPHTKTINNFKETTQLIVENLIFRGKNGFSVSLNKHYWTLLPKRYNLREVSSWKLKTSLDFLQSNEYITVYKGFRDTKTNISYTTRVFSRGKLNRLIKKFNIHPYMITIDEQTERIILKSSKEKGKKLKDYPDSLDTEKIKNFIKNYENFINSYKFSFDNTPIGKIVFKRVFNNSSFSSGGRFYSQYQNLKKEERKRILCDGEAMTELDFKGMHIQMLYLKEGLTLYTGDVYYIKGYKKYRDIFKIALQIAINAKSKISAYSGMNKHLRANKINSIRGKKLLDMFSSKHKDISKYFFSGIGVKLQFLDSKIALEIKKEALKRKIPLLSVHDSFLVPKSKEKELKDIMNKASLKILKSKLSIDKKF